MTLSRKNAVELLNKGGIVKSSEWVTGKGRYTQSRALPELCDYFSNPNQIKIDSVRELRISKMPKKVIDFFAKNPKVKIAIVFVGTEKQEKELKAEYEVIKNA